MNSSLIDLIYLAASVLMLAGIWQFLNPGRAHRGNLLGGAGVGLAILATLAASGIVSLGTAVAGMACGAVAGAVIGLKANSENVLAWSAVLTAGLGLSSALVAGGTIHNVGAEVDAKRAEIEAEWKDIPEPIKRENAMKPPEVEVPWQVAASAAIAAAFGGLIAVGAVISSLKLAKSPLRKSLPTLEEPKMPQLALATVCLLFGLLLTAWPGTETFVWLLLLSAMALGYVTTIGLKIVDTPPVLAAAVAASGISLSAAGLVTKNIFMVTAGALVASGGAVVANSLARSLNLSVLGLLVGGQSSPSASRSSSAEKAGERSREAGPSKHVITGPDPDAPIL